MIASGVCSGATVIDQSGIHDYVAGEAGVHDRGAAELQLSGLRGSGADSSPRVNLVIDDEGSDEDVGVESAAESVSTPSVRSVSTGDMEIDASILYTTEVGAHEVRAVEVGLR